MRNWHRLILLATSTTLACAAPTAPAEPHGNTSQPNRAPQAQITFSNESSCTPEPASPCTVRVHADVSDPDGDTVSLIWSGCAKGTAADAACTITKPGDAGITLSVDDGQGHAVTAAATAHGLNVPLREPPKILGLTQFDPLKCCPDSPTLEGYGGVEDCSNERIIEASATGDCHSAVAFHASCLEDVWVDVYRTKASGTCSVTLKTTDFWGQVGTTVVTVNYPHK